MMTSGMYQNAGEFAARWPAGEIGRRRRDRGDCPAGDGDRRVEPELDDAGNSLAGVAMLEKLTQRMGRSVF
ncbi:hypothetical protein KPZU09_14670 [Klebsiella pneumoniae]|uniref:Glutaminase n=1 Tax=Klebsiella pneumoniae TaxID=573 RepID=A0A919LLX8_KLEPN|nr:hypothetical protein KPZU09_14670 [Klebsiella pneumoniae]